MTLSGRAFLVGFVTTLAVLALLGFVLPELVFFRSFARLTIWTSAASQYFPTARQIASLVNRQAPDPSKVAVIVGGNSIFRGAGQVTNDIWTKRLQDRLGPEYAVINLASDGGGLGGYALAMVEMLFKEGRKVLFVTNLTEAMNRPDGSSPYNYFYYDALFNRYLLGWPERESYLRANYSSTGQSLERQEFQVKGALNAVLRFDDFWSTIGYCCFNSTWTVHTSSNPFQGRAFKPDNEVHPPVPYRHPIEPELAGFVGYSKLVPVYEHVRAILAHTIHPELVPHTIMVEIPGSPYYERRLAPDVQQRLETRRSKLERIVSEYGIATLRLGREFDEGDFVDSSHLSASGGEKLARAVAPLIVSRADKLRYLGNSK